MPRDRRVRAYRQHRGDRGNLVPVTAVCEPREQHHRKPRRGEHRGRHDAQVQSRDNQQMGHPGARECLSKRLADFALVADHERAHLGVFRISKVPIEELADVSSYRFDLARRNARTMPDDLKSRRTERIFRRGHRRVNAVARHQSHVVEFAGITVVAGEMNSRAQPDFVAQLEASATEDRDSDIAAGRQHSSALLGGSLDPDIQPIAISFALGLAKQMSLDRNARTVQHRGHAM